MMSLYPVWSHVPSRDVWCLVGVVCPREGLVPGGYGNTVPINRQKRVLEHTFAGCNKSYELTSSRRIFLHRNTIKVDNIAFYPFNTRSCVIFSIIIREI